MYDFYLFFFSSRRRHTRWPRDWSSDVCSSDLLRGSGAGLRAEDSSMNAQQSTNVLDLVDDIQPLIDGKDFPGIVDAVTPASSQQLSLLLERLSVQDQAIVYRLLPKDRAIEVFELLSPGMQSDLIHGLQDGEVAAIFADLDPDDRVWLLDELPATLAPRLLHGLTTKERQLTAELLGYPKGSVDRKSTRLNSSHVAISYAVFCLK